MAAEVFTIDGIEIRRLKSGRCVREEEWEQFVELNEVCSLALFDCGSDVGLALTHIVHVKKRAFREASSVIHT